jgi:hypothetical protein
MRGLAIEHNALEAELMVDCLRLLGFRAAPPLDAPTSRPAKTTCSSDSTTAATTTFGSPTTPPCRSTTTVRSRRSARRKPEDRACRCIYIRARSAAALPPLRERASTPSRTHPSHYRKPVDPPTTPGTTAASARSESFRYLSGSPTATPRRVRREPCGKKTGRCVRHLGRARRGRRRTWPDGSNDLQSPRDYLGRRTCALYCSASAFLATDDPQPPMPAALLRLEGAFTRSGNSDVPRNSIVVGLHG